MKQERMHCVIDYIYRQGLGNHANAGPAYRSTSKRFLHLRTTIRPSTPPGVIVISRNKVFRKHDWRMKNAPQEKILRILFAVSSGSTVFCVYKPTFCAWFRDLEFLISIKFPGENPNFLISTKNPLNSSYFR